MGILPMARNPSTVTYSSVCLKWNERWRGPTPTLARILSGLRALALFPVSAAATCREGGCGERWIALLIWPQEGGRRWNATYRVTLFLQKYKSRDKSPGREWSLSPPLQPLLARVFPEFLIPPFADENSAEKPTHIGILGFPIRCNTRPEFLREQKV